jgi:hypothetical protein
MAQKTSSQNIILGPKLTTMEFFLSEFCIYLAQFAVFFIVTTLLSKFLNDKKALLSYLDSKINEHTMLELWVAIGCLFAVLGIIWAASSGATKSASAFAQRVGTEILHECPRLISATGSTLTGTLAATALYLVNHPQVEAPRPGWWLGMALFFGVFFFGVASSLSYYFKRHSYIRAE